MIDSNALLAWGIDLAPTIAFVVLAGMILWIVWRLTKRLLQSGSRRSEEPRIPQHPRQERREPILAPVTTSEPTLLDAADVLALKASIDALTQQVAALAQAMPAARPARPGPHSGPRIVRSDKDVSAATEPHLSASRRADVAS